MIHSKFFKNSLLFLLTLISIPAYSQRLYHYTTELPSLTVNQLATDGNTIYLATANGLVKYDGSWTVFNSSNTSNGLPSNNIVSIVFAGHFLFAGTSDNLSWYDGSNWKKALASGGITHIAADIDSDNPFPDNMYSTYIVSNTIGLQRFNSTTAFAGIDMTGRDYTTLKKGIHSYYNGIEKHIWFPVGSKFVHYDEKNNSFTESINLSTIYDSYYEDGFIYYTTNGGMGKYDVTANTKEVLINTLTGAPEFFVKDNMDNFWILYRNSANEYRIARYNTATSTLNYDAFIGSLTDISYVNDIAIDTDNRIWIATKNNGLFKFDPNATPEISVSNTISLSTFEITSASYQWYWSPDNSNARITAGGNYQPIDGATLNTYEVIQTGYYVVDITENGVTKSSDPVYVDMSATATLNKVSAIKLILCPNPSNGRFIIEGDKVVEVILTDVNGKTETYASNEIRTNLRGNLIITIKTEKGIVKKNIIVQ